MSRAPSKPPVRRSRRSVSAQEAEQRFRSTFEQAAVGIAHLTLDHRFLKVNRRYCEIVGYTESELIGHTATRFNHPEDRGIGQALARPAALRRARPLRAGEALHPQGWRSDLGPPHRIPGARCAGQGSLFHPCHRGHDRAPADRGAPRAREPRSPGARRMQPCARARDRRASAAGADVRHRRAIGRLQPRVDRVQGTRRDELGEGRRARGLRGRSPTGRGRDLGERRPLSGRHGQGHRNRHHPCLPRHSERCGVSEAPGTRAQARLPVVGDAAAANARRVFRRHLDLYPRAAGLRRRRKRASRDARARHQLRHRFLARAKRAAAGRSGFARQRRALSRGFRPGGGRHGAARHRPAPSALAAVNEKLCQILGYSREELLQLTSVDVTPPEDREEARHYNEQMLAARSRATAARSASARTASTSGCTCQCLRSAAPKARRHTSSR